MRAESARLAGTWLGDYEVLGRIGHGGMGAVYLARRYSSGNVCRLFALKVLHDHLIANEHAVAMLRDEARLAAAVHHPNIISVHSLEKHDGRHYLVMEYVEGCTLAQLLRRAYGKRFAIEPVLSIVLDALDGLDAAHRASDHAGRPLNLIHRDISCANILVGVCGTARVSDFGIAKANYRDVHTSPGVRKGKYAYMAPELVRGYPGDARADLFSAGVVLHNSLTGERLFRGTTDRETLANVLHKEVPRPSESRAAPPSCFDNVALRALERDPDNRFSSAAEMAQALRLAILEEGMLTARTDVGRWVRSTFGPQLDERWRVLHEMFAANLSASDLGSAAFVTDEEFDTGSTSSVGKRRIARGSETHPPRAPGKLFD